MQQVSLAFISLRETVKQLVALTVLESMVAKVGINERSTLIISKEIYNAKIRKTITIYTLDNEG